MALLVELPHPHGTLRRFLVWFQQVPPEYSHFVPALRRALGFPDFEMACMVARGHHALLLESCCETCTTLDVDGRGPKTKEMRVHIWQGGAQVAERPSSSVMSRL